MSQILAFMPLHCISFNGRLSNGKSRDVLHHLHGVGINWQKRTSINGSAYHDHHSEPIINRRSANYQPSSWNHILIGSITEKDVELENQTKILKKLEDEVRSMFDVEDMNPPLALIELINDIDQLGLSYRYKNSIKIALEKLQKLEESTGEALTKNNLHASAIYFRLLRQHGYRVCPDHVFGRLRDKNGNFKESIAMDVQGMLSLFEASHLAYEGENILNEAKTFTTFHLEEYSKEFVDDPKMLEQINHALELPYHHRMRRLEARWRIESYDQRDEKNQVLLELAKLDFNMIQRTLQNDLQEVSRWWKALGLADKLDFARERLMESLFWAVGMVFEPQFSKCRMAITKAFTMITVLDDIYDVYGSLNELEQFTDAVERWDLDAMKDLPDYMKVFFLALYNTVNELAYDTLKDDGQMIIPHLRKAWADLCRSFLQEAKWFYKKGTPTFDEYIENARISSSGAVQLMHCYFLVSENISKEAVQRLNNHYGFLQWPCTIFRLYNDFSSSTAEIERGETTNAITCYMNESGQSEELARHNISEMIEECWMKMNEETMMILSPSSPFDENFAEVAINLARISLCQYQYGDAHSAPDTIAGNRITSVIFEPISLWETKKSFHGNNIGAFG